MPKPAHPGMAGREPYVVALIDLDEGPRLMSNVIGADVARVAPGLAVRVTWEPLSDGRHLPLFEPVEPVEPVQSSRGTGAEAAGA